MFPIPNIKRIPAWGIVVMVSLTIFLASPWRHLRADGDGYYHYLYLVTLFQDGDLDFANQYQAHGNPYGDPNHPCNVNSFPPGSALVWLPTYALTHLIFKLRGVSAINPFDMRFQSMALSGTWIAAVLTFWLAWRWLRRTYDAGWVLLGLAGAVLGTPYLFYMFPAPSYAHVPSAFFLTLFLYLFFLHPDRVFAQGFTAGLAALTKHQSGLLVPLMLLFLVWDRREVKGAARFLAGALVPLLPLVLYWHHGYGRWLTVPQGSGYMTSDAWGAVHSIFSIRHGAVTWSPLLVFALAGLVLLAFRKDARLRAALAFFAAMVFVNGLPIDWWGGHSLGNRRWVDLFPFLAIGLCECAAAVCRQVNAHPRRWVLGVASVAIFLSALFNLGLMGAYRNDTLNHSEYGSAEEVYFPALRMLYASIGNPLSYPDSLPFALRYGVHPRVYDQIVGSIPNYDQTSDGPLLDPALARDRKYFFKGFAFDPVAHVEGSTAKIFVPLLMPQDVMLDLWMDGGAHPRPFRTRFNGHPVDRVDSYSWERPVRVYIPRRFTEYGTNVLSLHFEAANPDVQIGLAWLRQPQHIPFMQALPFGWIDAVRRDPSTGEVEISGWALGRKQDVEVTLLRYPGPRRIPAQERAPRWDIQEAHPSAFGYGRAEFVLRYTPETPPAEKSVVVIRVDERGDRSNLIVREMGAPDPSK